MDIKRRTGHLIGLALLALLAFLLRIYRLDAQSLWYDEGVTAYVAQKGVLALTRWTAGDIQPPLYYYLVSLWGSAAGWSEWSLRFLSVIFGTLAVPLLATTARRLTGQHRVGLLTALFVAIHPLLVYYSQEARMYAMLTTLTIAVGLVVVRLGAGRGRRSDWIAYVILAVAAIYTHYFAFFLLLALACALLIDRLFWPVDQVDPGSSRPSLLHFALANGVVLLLYLPWIATLFTRLAVDNSYWAGRLKVGEALRHVAISFTGGETVNETVAAPLMLLYAAITLVALLALLLPARRHIRVTYYSLLWLLLPISGVILLASFVPKFNARYVMIALPGLLLIWGAGLGGLATRSGAKERAWSGAGTVAAIAVALIVLVGGYANYNWYTDPAFTKDQWRELSQFLRPRIAEHEAVALVSGHAWPVWEYYAPDLTTIRLPDLEILDVDAVIGFEDTAEPLRSTLESLSDRPGVWLVGWQDEVIDPTGIVPAQLEIAGREKGMSTKFWGVSLRRFSQLKTNWIPDEPPIERALNVTFGAQVRLLGYDALDNGDLLLFWQRLPDSQAPTADWQLTGALIDEEGKQIMKMADRRLAGYDFPSFRWPDEGVVMGHLGAREWLGDPFTPGAYWVELGVYDANSAGLERLRTDGGDDRVIIGPIEVQIE